MEHGLSARGNGGYIAPVLIPLFSLGALDYIARALVGPSSPLVAGVVAVLIGVVLWRQRSGARAWMYGALVAAAVTLLYGAALGIVEDDFFASTGPWLTFGAGILFWLAIAWWAWTRDRKAARSRSIA